MSNKKSNKPTKELLKVTSGQSILSNSHRTFNLEEIWNSLGGLGKQRVEHASSILSPATYFINLMRQIEKKTVLPSFVLRLSI